MKDVMDEQLDKFDTDNRFLFIEMCIRDRNKIAQSRLAAAMEKGYADGRVTGEGTIEDTLASIPYRKNASCLEVYVRDCEDADEAYGKIMNVCCHNNI